MFHAAPNVAQGEMRWFGTPFGTLGVIAS